MIKLVEGSYRDFFTSDAVSFDNWFQSIEAQVNTIKLSKAKTACSMITGVPYVIKFDSHIEGPELIFTLGIHGNETAAFAPVTELMQDLLCSNETLNCGRLVIAFGNVEALKEGNRSVAGGANLNRILKEGGVRSEDSATHKRAKELMAILDGSYEQDLTFTERYHIDFHTATELTKDFIFCSLFDLEFAKHFGSDYIIALSENKINEYIGGTTLDYGVRNNLISLTFEAGTHYSKESVACSRKAMYEILHRTGVMGRITSEEKRHNPNIIQIEKIFKKPSNTFKFSTYKDGTTYKNFDFIPKGSVIGVDKTNGTHIAERHFIILLPTPPEIQSEGEEVCFLAIPTGGPLYQEWIDKGYFY